MAWVRLQPEGRRTMWQCPGCLQVVPAVIVRYAAEGLVTCGVLVVPLEHLADCGLPCTGGMPRDGGQAQQQAHVVHGDCPRCPYRVPVP